MKHTPKAIDTNTATRADLIKKLGECATFIRACGKEISRLEGVIKAKDAELASVAAKAEQAEKVAVQCHSEILHINQMYQDEFDKLNAKLDAVLTLHKH